MRGWPKWFAMDLTGTDSATLKKINKALAIVLMSGAIASGALAAPAMAAANQAQAPAALGHPKAWGMVTLTIDPSAKAPSLATTTNVGGGTWNYGTERNDGFKGCYSQYTHPSKYHSSTAIIASSNNKAYANAGNWSYAYSTAGWAYTCHVYWGTY